MSLVPPIKDGDFTSVRQAIQKLASNLRLGYQSEPKFSAVTIDELTASRIIAGDANGKLESIDLSDWVTGTANQITITDDGDGSITLSTPQDIGTSSAPSFAGLTLTGNLVLDTINISTDTSTGTKIGTATNQKLGFWNVAPAVQQATIADASVAAGDPPTKAEFDALVGKFNTLLSELETIGILASS
jgi:hypothetical protein